MVNPIDLIKIRNFRKEELIFYVKHNWSSASEKERKRVFREDPEFYDEYEKRREQFRIKEEHRKQDEERERRKRMREQMGDGQRREE